MEGGTYGSGGSGGYSVPGNILAWNGDDNGNGVEDRLEGPGPLQFPGGGPLNDLDLEPAILKVDDMLASAFFPCETDLRSRLE